MRFASIASGSSGNCIFTGTDSTHLLIDAGISAKRITTGLAELELTGRDLTGILLTHEHSDHIQGLGVFLRKNPVPVYGTAGTIRSVLAATNLGEYPKELLHVIPSEGPIELGDLSVTPIPTSHDAAQPCGYRITDGAKSCAVLTDLGEYTPMIEEAIRGLDVLLLESNHDIRMLETGPYPYYLKQRILSDHGHLSNEAAGQLLNNVLHEGMKHIFLGHLSRENNYPQLAYESVKLEITLGSCPFRGSDFPITVAARDAMSPVIEF